MWHGESLSFFTGENCGFFFSFFSLYLSSDEERGRLRAHGTFESKGGNQPTNQKYFEKDGVISYVQFHVAVEQGRIEE